jgi:hypothetical protein
MPRNLVRKARFCRTSTNAEGIFGESPDERLLERVDKIIISAQLMTRGKYGLEDPDIFRMGEKVMAVVYEALRYSGILPWIFNRNWVIASHGEIWEPQDVIYLNKVRGYMENLRREAGRIHKSSGIPVNLRLYDSNSVIDRLEYLS